MPNRLAFHDSAYSLPSVLKSSAVNEKKCTLLRTSVLEVLSMMTLATCHNDDHIEQAAIKFNLPHSIWLLHD